MITLRRGNDLSISWKITRGGQPEDFNGKRLSLYMTSFLGRTPVMDFEVSGNEIRWLWLGKEQAHSGIYEFTLVENEGGDDMYTVDALRALRLVDRNPTCCGCDGDGGDDNIDVTSVLLEGDLKVPSLAGFIRSDSISMLTPLTMEEYMALPEKRPDTMYVIVRKDAAK